MSYKKYYFLYRNRKSAGTLMVFSIISILFLAGFLSSSEGERSGRVIHQYAPTSDKICGVMLCSETGGKIIMPWEKMNIKTEQQNCFSSGVQVACDEDNEAHIEDESINGINQEIDEIESSIELNFTVNNSVLLFGKANVPVTIPLHQGYYMGNAVYYIVTDSSDPNYSEMITENQGWKVNLAPLLANATKDSLSKTYTFTNGVPGDGALGFQGEIFTSTPKQSDDYSALISHIQVTWNARTIPFILDSEKEMLIAEKQGFVELTPLNIVSNMPQIVWPEGQMPVKANKTLNDDTPFVGGQVLDIDLANMTTTFVAHRSWDSDGRTIYFIITDATPIGPALSLGVPHVQKNAALISNPAASDMFHFMNGVKGSGPLGFQQGIASASTGSGLYSPMSRIYFIEWNDLNSTALIKTKSAIDEFEKDGLLNVNLARPMAEDHIVNSPIVDLFR